MILNIKYLILHSRGGIHYAEKGEPDKNVYDYNMNTMYAYYMKQLNFMFPSTKPIYFLFTAQEFNKLQFYPFGLLYRVSFTNSHKFIILKN